MPVLPAPRFAATNSTGSAVHVPAVLCARLDDAGHRPQETEHGATLDESHAGAEIPHGTFANPANYAAQWFTFAILALVCAAVVARQLVKRLIEEPDAGPNLRLWANVGAAVALLGGAGHAIFTPIDPGERWLPTFDTVTIAWIGVAIAALLLPDISEFTVAGVSLKRGEIADLSIGAVNDTAELLRRWAGALNELLAAFDDVDLSAADAETQIAQFFALRSYEALEWLEDAKEERRLSVWLYDEANADLFFFFSNEIKDPETVNFRFPFGKGIVGTVYRDHRVRNERNATTLPVYESIRATPSRYRGILCIPIDYGDTRYGVLSIDRQKEEHFDSSDVEVMSALAAIYGTALGNQNARRLLSGEA